MDLLDLLNYASKNANLSVYLFIFFLFSFFSFLFFFFWIEHKIYSPFMNVASSNKITQPEKVSIVQFYFTVATGILIFSSTRKCFSCPGLLKSIPSSLLRLYGCAVNLSQLFNRHASGSRTDNRISISSKRNNSPPPIISTPTMVSCVMGSI